MNARFKANNVEDAMRAFWDMEEKGCSPSVVSYNMVVRGLCRVGSVGDAIEMMKAMIEKGMVPLFYTYDAY
ncbi:hypothetical protein CRYUN_Cryun23aG0048000 [Craigia yunnanensis]